MAEAKRRRRSGKIDDADRRAVLRIIASHVQRTCWRSFVIATAN